MRSTTRTKIPLGHQRSGLATQPRSGRWPRHWQIFALAVLALTLGAGLLIRRATGDGTSSAIGNFQRVATPAVSPGRPVPAFFLSALYCPFCAAERWALVDSFARFGEWSNLGPSQSTSGVDGLPAIPTYDLLHASYTSRYVALVHRDVADAQGKPLEQLLPEENALVNHFNPQGGIPFLLLDGAFAQSGSGYSPGLLAGKTFQDVQADLAAGGSSARAIHAEGDVLTALICFAAGGQPPAVCQTPTVRPLVERLR